RTGRVPALRAAALAELVRTDLIETPAWRAHYACLSADAAERVDVRKVLDKAGLRTKAEREALTYLRTPDREDDPLTSLATRAAFLQTLTCLGQADRVPRAVLRDLASDTAAAKRPVPALYAADALRAVGVEARTDRAQGAADALPDADCSRLDSMERSALVLLTEELPGAARDCLRPGLDDPDPQIRWLVRRALAEHGAAKELPAPSAAAFTEDGLVRKAPAQLGTLTATYDAARALTASAQADDAPQWLTKRLVQLGDDPELDPSDRVLLAMTCHRLALSCGRHAEQGLAEAKKAKVPARLGKTNERSWYGAVAARAEFGLGCPRTEVDLARPAGGAFSAHDLKVLAILAEAGCDEQVARLTKGTGLVKQVRGALRDGELKSA
ncbi:hypothetical protein P8605_42680, partial [Streptomyces sp. T-3]|nr:hypothetical protein [Streptomyces sp. T-3]